MDVLIPYIFVVNVYNKYKIQIQGHSGKVPIPIYYFFS